MTQNNSLEQLTKEELNAFRLLAEIVKTAILDPEKRIRGMVIESLDKRYNGDVRRGYAENGYLFLDMKQPDGSIRKAPICTLPETYDGKPIYQNLLI